MVGILAGSKSDLPVPEEGTACDRGLLKVTVCVAGMADQLLALSAPDLAERLEGGGP